MAKLGGDGEFQLKISLPFADLTLNIPTSSKAAMPGLLTLSGGAVEYEQ